MDIGFSCPECRGTLIVDERGAGRVAACPMCGAGVEIPQPNLSLYLRAAHASEACGDCKAALKTFTDISRLKPTEPEAWLGIARAQAKLIDHANTSIGSDWKSIVESIRTAVPFEPRRSSLRSTAKAIRELVMGHFLYSMKTLAKGLAESQSAGFGKDKPIAAFLDDQLPVLHLLAHLRLLHAIDAETCDVETLIGCTIRALMPYEHLACSAIDKVIDGIEDSRKHLMLLDDPEAAEMERSRQATATAEEGLPAGAAQ